MTEKIRCAWCDLSSQEYVNYHDNEWGVPVRNDDRLIFELLILEGAQAGLSWLTILKRRQNYKRAFDNFEIKKVANYNEEKIASLISDVGIIRNKLKIKSAVRNAKIALKIIDEFGSLGNYFWSWVNDKQIKNNFKDISEIPTQTALSEKISKDLKKRGMSFVGPTIIYSFIQAIGIVNDHTTNCFRCKN
ncbi:DNA-3-methyladenine glycosylase I [Lentisphaerota bacterium WC36G]|nr:DNA-3-methyladenine glycosylase I [Lentisphaerae bacterium WC36]